MGDPKKKKTPAEELIESLMKDVGDSSTEGSEVVESDYDNTESSTDGTSTQLEGLVQQDENSENSFLVSTESADYGELETGHSYTDPNNNPSDKNEEAPVVIAEDDLGALSLNVDGENKNNLFEAMGALQAQSNQGEGQGASGASTSQTSSFLADSSNVKEDLQQPEQIIDKEDTALLEGESEDHNIIKQSDILSGGDSEKTVAVAGYQVRPESSYEDRVKVSVGQNRGASTGYQSWSSGGAADSSLAQAESLRIAQDKIIELERENEKLRQQNEELIAASEIIKERSDLLSNQMNEVKNDREGLEESFKSEIVLLKNHLSKKEAELQKSQIKIEELDSRLKFDMKKIRIRERELENRLELVRAEKNAIVKNKDEQILDLRRKMDVLQMEVESYRQKCVELNKSIESSQESFKRTTRALRLAMANLELQDENKPALKKVD